MQSVPIHPATAAGRQTRSSSAWTSALNSCSRLASATNTVARFAGANSFSPDDHHHPHCTRPDKMHQLKDIARRMDNCHVRTAKRWWKKLNIPPDVIGHGPHRWYDRTADRLIKLWEDFYNSRGTTLAITRAKYQGDLFDARQLELIPCTQKTPTPPTGRPSPQKSKTPPAGVASGASTRTTSKAGTSSPSTISTATRRTARPGTSRRSASGAI